MARNKQLRKRVEGELRVIEEHFKKIALEEAKADPNVYLIDHWKKDIARHQRLLADYRAKLERRK
jgi:hypothetical protein